MAVAIILHEVHVVCEIMWNTSTSALQDDESSWPRVAGYDGSWKTSNIQIPVALWTRKKKAMSMVVVWNVPSKPASVTFETILKLHDVALWYPVVWAHVWCCTFVIGTMMVLLYPYGWFLVWNRIGSAWGYWKDDFACEGKLEAQCRCSLGFFWLLKFR